MSKHKKYTPKHRAPVQSAPKRAIHTTVVLSSVAAAATGIAVGGGLVNGSDTPTLTAAAASFGAGATVDAEVVAERRTPTVSRSDRRTETQPTAEPALLSAPAGDNAVTRTEDHSDDDPKELAKVLLAEFGFGSDQFSCLDSLWTRESNWRWNADNPTSSAYGIPQALPGSKMASAGADWQTNPLTQIRWGLGYIQDRYGSPCSAWGHSQSRGWY